MVRYAIAMTLTVALLTGCGGGPPPPAKLTIGAGGQGGVYFVLGTALAKAAEEQWETDASVVPTAASIENIKLLGAGSINLGFATVDSAALGMSGQLPFSAPVAVAALAGLYEDYLQIVVRANSDIRELADLRARLVSTGSTGSGTEVVAERILAAAGLNIDTDIQRKRLSAADSAQAIRDGSIDAFFFTGGLPTPAVADLAKVTPIRLISIDKYLTELQSRYGEVYTPRSIPSSMYGLGTEVATIGITNVVLVRADLPESDAYHLTALLFAAKDELVAAHPEARRLSPSGALATFPVPLHPGAVQYYRDGKA